MYRGILCGYCFSNFKNARELKFSAFFLPVAVRAALKKWNSNHPTPVKQKYFNSETVIWHRKLQGKCSSPALGCLLQGGRTVQSLDGSVVVWFTTAVICFEWSRNSVILCKLKYRLRKGFGLLLCFGFWGCFLLLVWFFLLVENWCGWWQRQQQLLKAVETAWPLCLRLNFSHFITPSSLSHPQEALSKPSKSVMFLLENSLLQCLHSSGNTWDKGGMKNEEELLHPFPFLQRMNLLPPTPTSSRTLRITCFFLGRWAKEAGWEGNIYSSPPVYVPFLADVTKLCTNAGRREFRQEWEVWQMKTIC